MIFHTELQRIEARHDQRLEAIEEQWSAGFLDEATYAQCQAAALREFRVDRDFLELWRECEPESGVRK